MLHEYAVEPEAIGSDWKTFRYLLEKFGFDRGETNFSVSEAMVSGSL